jgi:Tol biopolymer transport system component
MKVSSIKIAVLLTLCVFLIQCAVVAKDKIEIPLIDLQETVNDKGNTEKTDLKYTPIKTSAYLEVLERSPNITSMTRVTTNEDDEVFYGFITTSPVDDVIVYSITEPLASVFQSKDEARSKTAQIYTNNIWSQRVGSYAKTRLTYSKRIDVHPSFTPDGQHIVFSADRSGNARSLWRASLNGGGGLRRLTSTATLDFHPNVSSDGDTVAFSSIPEGTRESQIWTVSMERNLMTQLREGKMPRISPNGKKLSFLRKENDNYCDDKDKVNAGQGVYQVWIMSLEGHSETQLTTNVNYCVRDSNWSPDNKWIVYSSNESIDSQGAMNYDIWAMSADGRKKLQLTMNGSMDIAPVFDRTGEYLYFVSNRGGLWNIWRFKPILD